MRHATFATVVVGVDGDSGGDDAAALARRIAGPGTTIALVHIAREDESEDAGRRPLQLTSLRFEVPCLKLTRASRDVASGLEEVARDLSADAIVVGSPASRRPGGPTPDLAAILHRAPCAVAVAPRGEAQRSRAVRRVGVAYRDSPSGRAALRLAREIAAANRAEVHAMTVVPLLPSAWLGPTLAGAEGANRLSGEAALRARSHLDALPGIHGIVTEGDPAAQLTRFSRTVDLLVVGTRGHGALRRLLVGSTAEVLLTASACPVLVVPGGAVGAPRGLPDGISEPARLGPR